MPVNTIGLSDAWDDNWEAAADTPMTTPVPPPAKLTKAQRRAQHAELNRQIWESADSPEPRWYPETRSVAPVAAPFKPSVTLLARKPAPQAPANSSGDARDNEDEDSEEEHRKRATADFEERKARAQLERAEKERKYAEARERIFGSPAISESSRSSSPSAAARGKARGRGARDAQPCLSNEQSPARNIGQARPLYEPSFVVKPGSAYVQKRDPTASRPTTPSIHEKPLRQPYGPGRGSGRGFASRGNHHAPSGLT